MPKTEPSLHAVQGGRSPLSPSLWPARPPEEGERGTSGASGATERRVGGGETRGRKSRHLSFM
jgi:hypothetical protein